jgi:hypothetical protein
VDADAAKYRTARAALLSLRGPDTCEEYRELKLADIQLDEEHEVDVGARKKLSNVGSSKAQRQGPLVSSKKKTFSWIWTAGGGPGEDEEDLHECKLLVISYLVARTDKRVTAVRVEWSKAKARKERWEEEVDMLREEMKRVLRFLRWRSLWWETRRTTRQTDVSRELAAGLEAYAARQAALHREIARRFKTAWDTSAAMVVQAAVRDDAVLLESMAAFARIVDGEVDNVGGGARSDAAGAGASSGRNTNPGAIAVTNEVGRVGGEV